MTPCLLTFETVVHDHSNSAAVAYAAAALRHDLRRKLGWEHGGGRADRAGRIELGLDSSGGVFDSHSIEVRSDRVTITGTDELGLIHGLYAFSERWLDADPCRYFTEIVPALAERIEIPCGTTVSKPYTFRHRGFFFNDEDLLVGFHMEKPEHGFSMEVWRELFELALRMQCTCVIPGTNILPDEPQIKLASDMGLYIAQHHAEPLGSAPFFWPRGTPFSWSTDRAAIIAYWRKALERQAGKKVLWTLNFRGLLDRPFWVDDPNLTPDAPAEQKARIINEVLAAQYELIREVRREDKPEVFGYLWGELYDLYNAGLLRYPATTTIVHTDDGDACLRRNLEDLVRKSPYTTGVYEHISMFNGAQSMRVTSYAPRVFARELKRAVDLGMNRIFILNVGNLREKIFNLRQVMGYANDYEAMTAIAGGDGGGYFDWYTRWVLGTEQREVADAYRALTGIPFAANDERPDNTVGDNFYPMVVRFTLQRVYNREDKPLGIWGLKRFATLRESLAWLITHLAAAEPKWEIAAERARDAVRHLQGNRRTFFEHDAVAQLDKMLSLTRMTLAFCRSATHYLDGRGHDAYLEAWQALRHVEDALAVEKRLETGKFKGWHRNDLNCRNWKCRDFLTTWHAMLDDQRWLNLEGMAEGPQPCYAAYKYNPNFPTAYRSDLFLQTER
ncbi:MAG: glycosyl hydrolase 115 family protein [bacterium]